MPCLVVILALLLPRVAIFLIWLFTPWFAQAFHTAIWPVLGFLFMPYTTLAYLAAMLNGGLAGGWVVLLIVAVLVDLAHMGFGGHARRRR